eukprot:351262-Chlamydomonas_euryale.AAC.2
MLMADELSKRLANMKVDDKRVWGLGTGGRICGCGGGDVLVNVLVLGVPRGRPTGEATCRGANARACQTPCFLQDLTSNRDIIHGSELYLSQCQQFSQASHCLPLVRVPWAGPIYRRHLHGVICSASDGPKV